MIKKKYSLNVIKKSIDLKLKFHKETDEFIIYLSPAISSNNDYYRVTYNKLRDEFNCDCQKFKFSRKCSHSLKAIREVKGNEAFWNETQKNKIKK